LATKKQPIARRKKYWPRGIYRHLAWSNKTTSNNVLYKQFFKCDGIHAAYLSIKQFYTNNFIRNNTRFQKKTCIRSQCSRRPWDDRYILQTMAY
jgi:hypothetical protein